jgi:hypothetical protein
VLKRQGGQFFPGEEKLTGGIANLDDYSACEISQKRDWRDLFVTPFYFGCEADDPSNVWAFNARANPLGAIVFSCRSASSSLSYVISAS